MIKYKKDIKVTINLSSILVIKRIELYIRHNDKF